MADDKKENPSSRAMKALGDRIMADNSLDEKLKEATLGDLSGQNPTGLEQLKAFLSRTGQTDETGNPESA